MHASRPLLIALITIAATSSCLDISCMSQNAPIPTFSLTPGEVTLWRSDVTTLVATSVVETGGPECFQSFTSTSRPASFAFSSASPAIASVSPAGTVISHDVGQVFISATDGLKIARSSVHVSEPVADIRLTITPANPTAGAKVTILAEALKADGTIAAGANFGPMDVKIRRPGGLLPVIWFAPPLPTGYSGQFVAAGDATHEITVTSPRTGHPSRTATRTFVVPPA